MLEKTASICHLCSTGMRNFPVPGACKTYGFHTIDRNKNYSETSFGAVLGVLLSCCASLMLHLQENSALHSSPCSAGSASEKWIFTMGARYCLDLHHSLWSVTTWPFVIKNALLFHLLLVFQILMDDLAKVLDPGKGKESTQNAVRWGMDSFAPHTIGGNTIFWEMGNDFKLALSLVWTGIWNNFADTEQVRSVFWWVFPSVFWRNRIINAVNGH